MFVIAALLTAILACCASLCNCDDKSNNISLFAKFPDDLLSININDSNTSNSNNSNNSNSNINNDIVIIKSTMTSTNLHVHYKNDQQEASHESQREAAYEETHAGRHRFKHRYKPVVYFETIFSAAPPQTQGKQIVNLSGLKNKLKNEKSSDKNKKIPDERSVLVPESYTHRFKKRAHPFTPFPVATRRGGDPGGATTIQSEGNVEPFGSGKWRNTEADDKETTERMNLSETRQMNLYRYHYNHFFWHPSRSTTFWLLVVSGILLSLLVTGLAAILYLCHRDHGVSKMELHEQDFDGEEEEEEEVVRNRWSGVERNPLAMELSATSKTELLTESDSRRSNESSASRHTNEASETSFDLRHSSPAQLLNSIFSGDEANKKSESFGASSADGISEKCLVECNYYWSNSNE